jgi:hypothetical protein
LSQKQINEYSIKAENQILKNLTTIDGKWFHIKNLTRFDEELGRLIGLSDTQVSAFIIEDRKQLEIDHMNYFKETPLQSPSKTESFSLTSGVSINSASAPFGNEQTLPVPPQNPASSGFDVPIAICSVLIGLLMVHRMKDN